MIQSLAKKVLTLMGWKLVGDLPKDKKFVLIVAPHTSNWDFVVGIIARFVVARKVNFLAKRQLFIFPLGLFFRSLGGFPVDRSKSHDLVSQVVSEYARRDAFILGITPEGTRSPVKRWKTGFYHIACRAEVPLVMVAFDYEKKEVIIRPPFMPSHDISQDFAEIHRFYRGVKGRYPKEIPEFKV